MLSFHMELIAGQFIANVREKEEQATPHQQTLEPAEGVQCGSLWQPSFPIWTHSLAILSSIVGIGSREGN
jgi:hypothetical protein